MNELEVQAWLWATLVLAGPAAGAVMAPPMVSRPVAISWRDEAVPHVVRVQRRLYVERRAYQRDPGHEFKSWRTT